ncbi:hypothetical protein DFJ74DRAFT_505317 [Hyaloraphidium curvatum]|nr:hypothetical protein DFJ74DRAFT_505317 [Hyaloraphidium curvatum]
MDSDPLYYLAPDFEPGNLTVAELASVLTANDVPVPQTKAKKATYVELFQKHITGKRSQLLKQYKLAGSIKPSRRGIVAVAADGTERELGSSDEEEAHDTRSRSGRNRPTKNRRSSSVPAPEPQLSTRPTRARNQSPERLLARIHPDAEEAPPTRSGRNTRKKKADEQPRSQVNDFQSDGENSPPAKGNSRGRKEAVKTSPKPQRVAAAETPAPDTPRRRVQLRRMMSPSAGATDSERVPPPTVFTPKSKSTAQYDMATWVSKTVDVSDSVDDVYGTGPQALRALKNIPYEKDLQCQFHIPAVTRASQLIGIRLLDEKIFDEVLKRVAEAPNRLRLRDAVESWLAAHGITFGDKKLGSSMTPKHAAGGKSTAQFDFASWTQKDITMTETVDNIWGTGPATLKELKALPADYEFVGFYFCPAITTAGQLLGLRLLGKDEFAKVGEEAFRSTILAHCGPLCRSWTSPTRRSSPPTRRG